MVILRASSSQLVNATEKNTHPKTQENPKAYVSISYVKRVLERIRLILSLKNIKTALKEEEAQRPAKKEQLKAHLQSGLQNIPIYVCWGERLHR